MLSTQQSKTCEASHSMVRERRPVAGASSKVVTLVKPILVMERLLRAHSLARLGR